MKNKYRYVNEKTKSAAYGVIGLWGLLSLYFLFTDRDLSEKLFIIVVTLIVASIGIFEFGGKADTYIELSDEGILFSSNKERIFSPWEGIRKIKIKPSAKIITRNGSFTIGWVAPFEYDPKSIMDIMKNEMKFFIHRSRMKWQAELMDEIMRRAPHAIGKRSILDYDVPDIKIEDIFRRKR